MKKLIILFFLLHSTILFAQSPYPLARESFAEGDFYTALKLEQEEKDASNLNVIYIKALSYFYLGDYEQAKNYFNQLNPNQFSAISLWLRLIALETEPFKPLPVNQDKESHPKTASFVRAINNFFNNNSKKSLKTEELLLIAHLYTKAGQAAEAISIYDTIIDQAMYLDYSLYFRAKAYLLLNQRDLALEQFQSLNRLYPKSLYGSAALYEIAALDQKNQKKHLEKLINSDYNPIIQQKARRLLANIYYKEKNQTKLQQLIDESSDNEDRQAFTYNLALLQESLNKNKALLLMEQVAAGPNAFYTEKALYAKARYLDEFNRTTEAIQTLNRLSLSEGPLLLERGSLLLQLYRQNEQSETVYTLADDLINNPLLAQSPSEQRSYLYLMRGWAYQHMNQTAYAMSDYSTVIKNNSAANSLAFEAAYRIGLVYAKRGQPSRAEEYFQILVTKQQLNNEEHGALLFAQSLSAYQAGQWKKSIRISSDLIKQYPLQSNGARRILAASYAREGFYRQASTEYRIIASSADIMMQDALYLAGINAYRAGDYQEAIRSFNHLLNSFKENDGGRSALFWLGKSYSARSQWKEASGAFEKSLAIKKMPAAESLRVSPSDRETLYESVLALYKIKSPLAEKRFNDLKSRYPEAASDASYVLAEEALSEGSYDKAAHLFDQVQENTDGLGSASLYKKALSLELAGQQKEAVSLYIDYLRSSNPSSEEQIMAARRLAKIVDHRQLGGLVRGKNKLELPVKSLAPLALAWVKNAYFYEQDGAFRLLDQLKLSEIDELERSTIGLSKGQLLFNLKRYEASIGAYEAALAMALSPSQYVQARTMRSKAYETMGQYAKATQELLLIQQAFEKDEAIASEALYQAWELCTRQQLNKQAAVLAIKLRQTYPASKAAQKVS